MSKEQLTHHINTRKIQRSNARMHNIIGMIVLCIFVFIATLVFTACDGTSDKRPIVDLSSIQAVAVDSNIVTIVDCHGDAYELIID